MEWGYNAHDYQAFFDKYAAEGYGQALLSVTGSASDPLFAAVWQPMSPIPLTRFGLTADELATIYNDARLDSAGDVFASTTMPLSLDVYGTPGNRRYAVVMVPNAASTAWNGDGTDDSSADYQTRFNVQTSVGGRPYLVSPTGDGDYASVFRDDQIGDWQARHGLTAAQYQQTFDSLTAKGLYPIEVQGGGVGDRVRFAAVFAATNRITPRVFSVAGSPTSTKNDPYDAAMHNVMTTYGIRHASLALVKGSRLVLARGYTYAEPGYPAAQPITAFRQASCSKTVTAILIHQLVHEGKLNLSDTVQSILNLKPPNGTPLAKNFSNITVEHLLDHNSGVPTNVADTTILSAFLGAKLPITPAQFSSWLAGQPLTGTPGSAAAWQYNNFG
ncbi:hypothetical protein M2432_000496 [Mycobacterium sp. OTB74]|nr:hypothetical protein [Mycobacterium sp. OTB74]